MKARPAVIVALDIAIDRLTLAKDALLSLEKTNAKLLKEHEARVAEVREASRALLRSESAYVELDWLRPGGADE